MPDRIILYTSGADDQLVAEQTRQGQELCAEQGYEIVGVARESPGSTDAWEDAHQTIRDGDADRIVVASGADLPDMLESATGSIPGGRLRRQGAHRRVRMLRRDAGA